LAGVHGRAQVMQEWNFIASTCPRICSAVRAVVVPCHWCMGFLAGMRLRMAA
jgi:hypothetical protein